VLELQMQVAWLLSLAVVQMQRELALSRSVDTTRVKQLLLVRDNSLPSSLITPTRYVLFPHMGLKLSHITPFISFTFEYLCVTNE
jgi:hypothetical protein